MTDTKKNDQKFSINDRVRRAGKEGNLGTVTSVREEVSSAQSAENKDKSMMIQVQWDNGTSSYLSPAGLEVQK